MEQQIRINKYLVICGLGSRRKVEEYIKDERITINDEIAALTDSVTVGFDVVKLDRRVLKPGTLKYYIILNKPKGFITTADDPFERRTVMDLIPEKYKSAGVFPVGRLDKDTEGLLLLTNDGELSYKLMHPKFDSEKEYIVKLDRPLHEADKIAIERGVLFQEFKAKPCKVEYVDRPKKVVRITISEGKKRQIRLTFAKFSYYVKKLERVRIGPLHLGSLPSARCRDLRAKEVSQLKKYAGITDSE